MVATTMKDNLYLAFGSCLVGNLFYWFEKV
jgi:hypothetical protein